MVVAIAKLPPAESPERIITEGLIPAQSASNIHEQLTPRIVIHQPLVDISAFIDLEGKMLLGGQGVINGYDKTVRVLCPLA